MMVSLHRLATAHESRTDREKRDGGSHENDIQHFGSQARIAVAQ
jgi:hypothetical protein